MLGVAATPVAARFLEWWQDRVYAPCRTLQPLWDALRTTVAGSRPRVVRRRSCTARSRLHRALECPDRAITLVDDVVLVNGEPCRLFRFSGYDTERPMAVTRYSSRLTRENVGPARIVFDRFHAALERHGYRETQKWPYGAGAFESGAPVPNIRARSLLAEMGDAAGRFGDPLRTGPGRFSNGSIVPLMVSRSGLER